MGLIAGLLAQNLLKYFLNFGEVSYLQSYNALLNFFDDSILLPNPECKDENCVKLQDSFKEKVILIRDNKNILIEIPFKKTSKERNN